MSPFPGHLSHTDINNAITQWSIGAIRLRYVTAGLLLTSIFLHAHSSGRSDKVLKTHRLFNTGLYLRDGPNDWNFRGVSGKSWCAHSAERVSSLLGLINWCYFETPNYTLYDLSYSKSHYSLFTNYTFILDWCLWSVKQTFIYFHKKNWVVPAIAHIAVCKIYIGCILNTHYYIWAISHE